MPVQSKVSSDKVLRVPEIVRDVLKEELLAEGLELEGRVKAKIREKNAIATGQMVGSYAVSQPAGSEKVIAVRVGTPVEHGNYMEFGTTPHVPPLEPIMRWVENKLNVVAVGVTFKGGKAVPTGKGIRQFSRIKNIDARQAAIRKIANAIRFSMAKRGLRPRHFVREALDSMGVQYALRNFVYEIDTIEMLAKNNQFWSKVKARLQ